MTEEQKLTLRCGILLQLNAAYPGSLKPKTLKINLKLVGDFKKLDEETLDQHLRYLERRERIEREGADGGLRQYLITDAGRAWLDENDLL
jgi:hypothetical protein